MESLSVFRSENKYRLSFSEALSIQNRLSLILDPDPYTQGKAYSVRSLYFDSLNSIDYATKLAGTEIRKKIRLRVYSPEEQSCKLENKQKNGELQHKTSVVIAKADAMEMIDGNLSMLTKHFTESPALVDFYTTMMLGAYRPACMIEYQRVAYVYPMYHTRITLDYCIRCSESCFDLFSPQIDYTDALCDEVVLEVKYDGKLMGFISDAIKPYHLVQTSTSKYCLGRKAYYDFLY